MKPIMIGVLILVLASIVSIRLKSQKKTDAESVVLSVTYESPSPSSNAADELQSPTPSATPLNNSTPDPSSTTKNSQSNDFIYPGSKYIGVEGEVNVYESTNSPEDITNWYKEKIRSLGFNIKAFVSTKTNNNILNKLVGSSNEKEIKIEISKPSDSSIVKIVIK